MRPFLFCASLAYNSHMLDFQTLFAALLTFTLAYFGLGRDLPFDTVGLAPLVSSLILFIGYLYLTRSLVRLPFALVITVRSARRAARQYGLNRRESLRDGFVRGFLDTRRWTVAPLVSIDRLAVVGFTLMATTPYLGVFVLRFGGLVGIAVMLILYLFRGSFSFLLDHSLRRDSRWTSSLPFLKTRDD
jgi:hypothetical protein